MTPQIAMIDDGNGGSIPAPPLFIHQPVNTGNPQAYTQARYDVGNILPCPTEAELKFIEMGAAEYAEEFWPGLIDSMRSVAGNEPFLLPPCPKDASLWVRMDLTRIQRLNTLDPETAVQAVMRCEDTDALELVDGAVTNRAVIDAAAAALAVLEGDEDILLVALAMDYSTPVAYSAAGETFTYNQLFDHDLLPLIKRCTDVRVLERLEELSDRQTVYSACVDRRAELCGDPEQAATPILVTTDNQEDGVLVQTGEETVSATKVKVDDLKPLITACDNPNLLEYLAALDTRKGVQEACAERVAELSKLHEAEGDGEATE